MEIPARSIRLVAQFEHVKAYASSPDELVHYGPASLQSERIDLQAAIRGRRNSIDAVVEFRRLTARVRCPNINSRASYRAGSWAETVVRSCADGARSAGKASATA